MTGSASISEPVLVVVATASAVRLSYQMRLVFVTKFAQMNFVAYPGVGMLAAKTSF